MGYRYCSIKPLIVASLFVLLSIGLTGCGMLGYEYIPFQFEQPQIKNVSSIGSISTPTLPEEESKSYDIQYDIKETWPESGKDYTGNTIKAANTKPSVLIGLPNEAFEEKSIVLKEYNLFETKDYASTREQIIEKSLIFKGFDVRDRSNFEATLKDLRDKRAEGDGKGATNISEMISAANGRADYIFLVNKFSINKVEDSKIDFRERKEFNAIQQDLKQRIPLEDVQKLKTSMIVPGYRAKFTAKLINVEIGSIEWIGSYEVTSSDIRKFEVKFSYDKLIENKIHILDSINSFNARLSAQESKLKRTESDYQAAFKVAKQPLEFDSEEQMMAHTQSMRRNYESAKSEYYLAVRDYKSFNDEKLELISAMDWKFDYRFYDPVVTPDFSRLSNNEISSEFEPHIKQLLESVAEKLVNTINVE